MAASVLLMSMSVDGYIAGPNDAPGNPGGDGFMRLHEWYKAADGDFGRPDGPAADIWDELNATGAVLVGRRTAEQGDWYGGDHHGVPIFVLSRQPAPEAAQKYETVTFVTDVESAMAQAKAAAGDANVMVHGAALAQALLRARVLDELEIHLIPILLGAGRRLFDGERIPLELTRVIDAPGVTHLRYRVAA